LEKSRGVAVEQPLQHPGDPYLDRHASQRDRKPPPRCWHPVDAADSAQIDSLIALAMAAEPVPASTGSCSSGSPDRPKYSPDEADWAAGSQP
jgi:hypothetical protein